MEGQSTPPSKQFDCFPKLRPNSDRLKFVEEQQKRLFKDLSMCFPPTGDPTQHKSVLQSQTPKHPPQLLPVYPPIRQPTQSLHLPQPMQLAHPGIVPCTVMDTGMDDIQQPHNQQQDASRSLLATLELPEPTKMYIDTEEIVKNIMRDAEEMFISSAYPSSTSGSTSGSNDRAGSNNNDTFNAKKQKDTDKKELLFMDEIEIEENKKTSNDNSNTSSSNNPNNSNNRTSNNPNNSNNSTSNNPNNSNNSTINNPNNSNNSTNNNPNKSNNSTSNNPNNSNNSNSNNPNNPNNTNKKNNKKIKLCKNTDTEYDNNNQDIDSNNNTKNDNINNKDNVMSDVIIIEDDDDHLIKTIKKEEESYEVLDNPEDLSYCKTVESFCRKLLDRRVPYRNAKDLDNHLATFKNTMVANRKVMSKELLEKTCEKLFCDIHVEGWIAVFDGRYALYQQGKRKLTIPEEDWKAYMKPPKEMKYEDEENVFDHVLPRVLKEEY